MPAESELEAEPESVGAPETPRHTLLGNERLRHPLDVMRCLKMLRCWYLT
jgi:hypothetical protein